MNQPPGYRTIFKIYTFCRVVVMNVKLRYRRVLVIRSQAADKKMVTGETCLDLSFQEIRSLRVRLHGTLYRGK